MNTKGLIASARGRPEESLALIRRSLEVALENDTPSAALRAYTNLAGSLWPFVMAGLHGSIRRDRYGAPARLERPRMVRARMQIVGHQSLSGAWDDVLSTMREALESDDPGVRAGLEGVALGAMEVASNRGDVDEVNRFFATCWDDYSASDDVQARAIYAVVRAVAADANGERRQALVFAREAFDLRDALSHRHGAVKWSYPIAVSTALNMGDIGAAEELVSTVEAWKPGQVSPLMRAMTERFRACLAPDEPETDASVDAATGLLREIGAPFHRACTMLDHAPMARRQGDGRRRTAPHGGEGVRNCGPSPGLQGSTRSPRVV